MEAIDVFRRIDALDDRRAADVCGQRQLHQDAVDALVSVELIDQCEKLRLGSRCRQVVGEGHDADLLAGATLAAHVNPGGGVIAHLDDGQPRAPGTTRQRRCDRAAHLALHLPRQLPAIDELCCHALPSREKKDAHSRTAAARRVPARVTRWTAMRRLPGSSRGGAKLLRCAHHAVRGLSRGMAQSGSASALGAEGRGFKSLCPDQYWRGDPEIR